jgi:D-alanine-D-alanine ligase
MEKQTVAIVFGSRSTEHDVSIVTAITSIIKPLELSQKYNVIPVYITKDGKWYSDPVLKDINLYSSGRLDAFLAKQKPVALQFENGLVLLKPGLKNFRTRIDIVFPATHGTHGEDGELMALCELANVPYVGCDVRSSVVAMDKVLAKQVAEANGIATPKYVAFSRLAYTEHTKHWLNRINKELKYPLFVKPAHLGSSIGITRINSEDELANAIEVALHYDDKAEVEEAVPNLTEVTLPIMGNEEPMPALLEEPLLQAEDFFDFDTKYMQGGKKGKGKGAKGAQGYSKLPADLPKDLYDKAEQTGLSVYKHLGCSGTARVDMLIDRKSNKVYFNEVNPLPGGLYSHNWNKAGVSNVELVLRLIELAEQRFASIAKVTNTFDTNYLQQF